MLRSIPFIFLLLLTYSLRGQSRPNIIFIAADDLGYGDLSCYGNQANHTPQIDRLAAGGLRFTDAYAAAPVCTPSRTGFMTGRYPGRTMVGLKEPLDWIAEDSLVGLLPETPSLPSLLRSAGYHTALVGKWHLGFGPASTPKANGFDYFFGYKGGGVDYVRHTAPGGVPDLYVNDTAVQREGYLTDLLADEAIRFLRAGGQQPFFLSLQFSAPHWPWQSRGDAAYPLEDSSWKQGGTAERYAGMVRAMDEALGRVVSALQELHLDSNTLIVFTSDNGGERFSRMDPLRERKFVLWEGGIRVPCIAYWPGQISPGQVSRQPIIHLDWTASFLALAGAVPPPGLSLDGKNILAWLRQPQLTETRTFFWRVSQRNQQLAVRHGRWKYLETEKGLFLFDLDADPQESHNLIRDRPDTLQSLQHMLHNWSLSLLAPLPLGKRGQ